MNTTASGKTLYVAVSDNYAVRIRGYSKPKVTLRAALEFAKHIKNWKPENGGIIEKAHSKEIREYLSTHKDITWINEGRPIDA